MAAPPCFSSPQQLASAHDILLPCATDLHVHLRQGLLSAHIAAALPAAGVGTVLVMPNTVPPVATVDEALAYRAELLRHAPGVTFLMTLYLTPLLTVAEIRRAAATDGAVVAVKYYPRGVTTNSADGATAGLGPYASVLQAMQESNIVLCLHGECPSDGPRNINVMSAEAAFLDTLVATHAAYPRLRIVLEHATTRAAIETVRRLGPTVAATVTVHHLYLTVDDWAGGSPHLYCKPVAKTADDRDALRAAVRDDERVFLGTDSAPHPRHSKEQPEGGRTPPGVYSSAYVFPALATLLDELGMLDKLEEFACKRGRRFYGLQLDDASQKRTVLLSKKGAGTHVPRAIKVDEKIELVPFLAGTHLAWGLTLCQT